MTTMTNSLRFELLIEWLDWLVFNEMFFAFWFLNSKHSVDWFAACLLLRESFDWLFTAFNRIALLSDDEDDVREEGDVVVAVLVSDDDDDKLIDLLLLNVFILNDLLSYSKFLLKKSSNSFAKKK